MSDSEKLKFLLQFKGTIEKSTMESLRDLHYGYMDEINAMARIIGLKIDWKNDPREIEQIIKDDVQDESQQTILLERVKMLKEITEVENKAIDILYNNI